MPASLSQEVGLALGAQSGEARIREVAESAGFSRSGAPGDVAQPGSPNVDRSTSVVKPKEELQWRSFSQSDGASSL
jgi:hypothetical protein